MPLSYQSSLDFMRMNFPRWSDIRKRTNKSVGGGLLRAYAKEFDSIQDAIDAYQRMFFLVSYYGHEDEYIDYLYIAMVGEHDQIALVDSDCELTDDADVFYNAPTKYCLYQDGYLMFHEDALKEKDYISYQTIYGTYRAALTKRHIWNAFDEFATFAGLARYDDETNKELEERTLAVFKNFPNPSEGGLKRAITNAISNEIDIGDNDIEILPIDADTLDYTRDTYKNIYEDFAQYNRDIFRTKIWDKSNWENNFQKTGYIPHVWDEPMPITQNGVGYNDSLKVDFLSKIDASDYTDVTVSSYKKTERAIKEYIANNNVETSISLTLKKFNDSVSPKKVEYRLTATDVKEIDPMTIYVRALQKTTGTHNYYIEDLAQRLYNVERVDRNRLDSNQKYRLDFLPTDNYSSMEINRCLLQYDGGQRELRKASGDYVMNGSTLINKRVLLHATALGDLAHNENVISTGNGYTVGPEKDTALLGFDITGMQKQLLSYKVNCQEVDITDTSYITPKNGFKMDSDRLGFTDTQYDSLGSLDIKMNCNSYSFRFAEADDKTRQGSIIVTTVVNGKLTKKTYTSPQKISDSFRENSTVEIRIQKNGQNPVSVREFRMASYEVKLSLKHGDVISKAMYNRLPAFAGENMLYLELIPHTAIYPVLEYVHIGNSLSGAKYSVEIDTNNLANPSLSIDTNCNMKLYKADKNGTYRLTDKAYNPKALYRNTSQENGYITLDTADFVAIRASIPQIRERYNGGTYSYITLRPGESMDSIQVTGDISKVLTSRPLSSYLYPNNNPTNLKTYITKNADSMYVENTQDHSIRKVTINRTDINNRADSYRLSGLPDEVSVRYTYKDGSTGLSRQIQDREFDTFTLVYPAAKEYIAYNDISMIETRKSGIEIINTFSPFVALSKLLFYRINVPGGEDAKVVFANGNDWSLGQQTITVETKLTTDSSKEYTLDISHISNKYILSNDIPLEEQYLVDGEYHKLREYMISADTDISVRYDTIDMEENQLVEASLVTKLSCSNVSSLTIYDGSKVVSNSDYSVIGDAGLITWNNSKYVGKTLRVVYKVKNPTSLAYADWHHLYDLISYPVDAYERIEQKTFHMLYDGQTAPLDFKEPADKIVTRCSNSSFEATVQNGSVKVMQVSEEDKLAIHNGYIYDDGVEYYHFNDEYNDQVDKFANIELHNVTRQGGELLFHMRSKNYLPYSNMETPVLSKLCAIDLQKRIPQSISSFNHLTACESINLWYVLDMKATIRTAVKGLGTHFQTTAKKGYAVAEITDYCKKGNILSIEAAGDIQLGIVKETRPGGIPFAKSTFIDEANVVPLDKHGNFYYKVLDEDATPEERVYLYIAGKEGTIDNLISMPYTTIGAMEHSHTKNIDRFHFAFQETVPAGTTYELDFDTCGAKYIDTYCDSNNELHTTATLEYGLTKVDTADLEHTHMEYAEFAKDRIKLVKDDALVRTVPFYMREKSSVYAAYVKVNDILADEYKGFTITAYGSNTEAGSYKEVGKAEDTNLLRIPKNKIKSYMYVEVTGKKGKVVTSIETYAQFAELGEKALTSYTRKSGSFITKVYDIGTKGNYRFDGMDFTTNGHDSDVFVSIRGLRENKNDYQFTEWKKYDPETQEQFAIKFEDYQMFQFKVDIKNDNTVLKIIRFKMEATA